MPRSPTWLCDGLDAAALDAGRSAPPRMLTALVAAGLAAAQLSPLALLIWLPLTLACEVWTVLVARKFDAGRPAAQADRLHYLVSCLATSWVWNALPALFWATGKPALQLVAVITLAGYLVHAQGFAFRCWAVLAINGGSSAANIILLPLLLGGLTPIEQVTLYGAVALVVGYAYFSARQSRETTRALESARIEAEDASHAKSAFLAMMSHELRTPMNGVLGMAYALRRSKLTGPQSEQVETLIRSGDGLMTILNDILDLSKVEAGRLELEHTTFDLGEIGRQVEQLWAEGAAAKGLTLTLEIDEALPPRLIGDPTRVRQVLMNLTSNALKFTERGGVGLRIATLPSGAPDLARLEIAVSDTGPGLSPDQTRRLFEPFAQADASTARRFGGTRLGLSICRQLVDLMGGLIIVDSELGRGSTFKVLLDLEVAAEAQAAEPAPDDDTADLTGLRVLVAEDNPVNQAVARAILEAVGAEVDTADDGAQALDRLGEKTFDLVLMDIHMPRMDGLEALSRIRAGHGGQADIPVIALTADAMNENRVRFLAVGFQDVQAKPIQPAQLVESLARVAPANRRAA